MHTVAAIVFVLVLAVGVEVFIHRRATHLQTADAHMLADAAMEAAHQLESLPPPKTDSEVAVRATAAAMLELAQDLPARVRQLEQEHLHRLEQEINQLKTEIAALKKGRFSGAP